MIILVLSLVIIAQAVGIYLINKKLDRIDNELVIRTEIISEAMIKSLQHTEYLVEIVAANMEEYDEDEDYFSMDQGSDEGSVH